MFQYMISVKKKKRIIYPEIGLVRHQRVQKVQYNQQKTRKKNFSVIQYMNSVNKKEKKNQPGIR